MVQHNNPYNSTGHTTISCTHRCLHFKPHTYDSRQSETSGTCRGWSSEKVHSPTLLRVEQTLVVTISQTQDTPRGGCHHSIPKVNGHSFSYHRSTSPLPCLGSLLVKVAPLDTICNDLRYGRGSLT
jgi:hypothetical protein